MKKYIINDYEFCKTIEYLKKNTNRYIKEDLTVLLNENLELHKKIDILERIVIRENIKSDFEKIKKIINNERITKKELLWIDVENRRLCNYIYFMLTNRRELETLNQKESSISSFIVKDILSYTEDDDEIDDGIYKETIKSNAINHQEKYNYICDHIINLSYNKKTKLNLIDNLKTSWINVSEEHIITNFLSGKNINQCKWSVEYLNKNKNVEFDFKITSEKDYYDNVILYFDTCSDLFKKELLITKMKRAWSQKKSRDAKNGFKYYNFNMKENIEKKLSEMSRELNISKNLLVEKIIEKEYKYFKENIK